MATKSEGTLYEVHVDKGNITGKSWHGEFRAKPILSFGDQIRADRLKRDLLGPGPYEGVDPEVMAQARILSELQVRIVEAPEWWNGGVGHADTNLLKAVYKGAEKVADEWFAKLEEDGKKDQEALRATKVPAKK